MSRFIGPNSEVRTVEKTTTVHIRVPAESIWFDGHFPGEPILPGVAQVAMVTELLAAVLKRPIQVVDVSRVRFKQAIRPNEPITVEVTPKGRLPLGYGFRLWKRDELACSGNIKLRNPDPGPADINLRRTEYNAHRC